MSRIIHAPRGTQLTCKGWQQAAAMRMLMNNLDPDVSERHDELIVYGGRGPGARSRGTFDDNVGTLQTLAENGELLGFSGQPG